MKVLQLVPEMQQGGVERGIVEENRALVALGIENHVISSGGALLNDVITDGGQVEIIDVKSKNPITFFSRASKLQHALEQIKPDLVVVHSRVPGWIFKFANSKLKIPLISFPHGLNSPGRYSKILTEGDLIMTPSKAVAEHLVKHYNTDISKIRIVPRAIERERFNIEKLDTNFISQKRMEWDLVNKYVVMGLGRITQLKGYDTLLRAASILSDSIPNLKVVIVGEAEKLRLKYFEELKNISEELNLNNKVIFAGRQTKIAECLSLADVVVSSNTYKPEAFGRSMAEALAMNKPIVATRFGGALDIVEDGINGTFVDIVPESPDAQKIRASKFASAILKVKAMSFSDLRSPALEKFSFEKMINSTLSAYKEALTLHNSSDANK